MSDPFAYEVEKGGVQQTISYGDFISGEIITMGIQDNYSFSAQKGDRVTIRLNRVANQDDGSGSLNPVLALKGRKANQ